MGEAGALLDWKWLQEKVIRICPPLILAAYLAKKTYTLFFQPFKGNDFLEFWVAASLALAGKAPEVYDFARFHQALAAAAGGSFPLPWFYPPIFLLMVLPLGWLPYHAALGLWTAAGLGGYLGVIRAIVPHPLTWCLALAFPGVLINLDYGQNGLLSTALLGGGLVLLRRSPYLAGALLGVLWYKPNLALLIPAALLAGRCWRALAASLASGALLSLASGLILGWDLWLAFLGVLSRPMEALKTGAAALEQMPTVFSMVRMSGGSVDAAHAFQIVVAAGTLGVTVWVWARETPWVIRASLLVLGTLLFTPYASQYELVRLALPLAWVGGEVASRGGGAKEKLFLWLGWLTPLLSIVLARAHLVQVTPLFLMGFAYLILTAPGLRVPGKDNPFSRR